MRQRGTPKEFGSLYRAGAKITVGKGAQREVTEFYLNREQAIYLTTQAGTPKARAMTVFVVKVFDQYLRGGLKAVNAPPKRAPYQSVPE